MLRRVDPRRAAWKSPRPGPLLRVAASAATLTIGLACTWAPDDGPQGPQGRPGKAPPLAAETAPPPSVVSGISAAGTARSPETSAGNARVTGSIPGLSLRVVSTYAYRDWMPRMGGPRGEDGGSPLHVAIGLVLTNTGDRPIQLERSARIGPTGTPLRPVTLDDLADATPWPLVIEAGQQRPLQIGTRDGPFFPLGEALDLEIDLTASSGDSVRIAIDDLPIGRTD